jgi:hypothetical protein
MSLFESNVEKKQGISAEQTGRRGPSDAPGSPGKEESPAKE